MIDVTAFKGWVAMLPDTGGVAIDDGGLTVVHLDTYCKQTDYYYEIGGIPLPEDRYPIEDWRAEVAAGDTVLGYKEWLEHQMEGEDDGR